jgi:hypothetical protein
VARGWSLVTGWDLDLEWRGVHWTRWGFRANVNNDWWHGSRVEREEGCVGELFVVLPKLLS